MAAAGASVNSRAAIFTGAPKADESAQTVSVQPAPCRVAISLRQRTTGIWVAPR